jgi:ADP-L-glycero-D-manno-heptose 6-epimerase
MASVIMHAADQIQTTGRIKLFRSHRSDYRDGEQKRDFVYVMDVVDVLLWLMKNRGRSGIFNLGSGEARTFNDLALSVFKALGREPLIDYIDTPADIRDKYQYYTCADMQKLKDAGYPGSFTSIEEGVEDYITNYLLEKKIF